MNKLLIDYIKTGVEPFPDHHYGDGYRCSVYLKDGSYLPCVMLRESRPVTELALQRFEQEKKRKGIFRSDTEAYKKIVRHFLCTGNSVNDYDVAKIESSKFAIPLSLLAQIEGETTMAWTGFVFEMKDGQLLSYGTSFSVEFFDIPDHYTFDDVVAVHNHSYVAEDGKLKSLSQGPTFQEPLNYFQTVRREKPYFICYYDDYLRA